LPSQQRADVEQALSGAVRNLIVSVEAYPDLKSNVNFLELQKQLTETEDRIAAGRRFYNANVRVYNTKIESVPSNIIANMFKFQKATYFEVNDPTVRQAPSVSFGEIAYRGDQPQGQSPQQSAPAVGFGGPQDALPNPQAYQQAPPYQQQYNQPGQYAPQGQSYPQGGSYPQGQSYPQGGYGQQGGYSAPNSGGYSAPNGAGSATGPASGASPSYPPAPQGGYGQPQGGYSAPDTASPQSAPPAGGYQPPDAYPQGGAQR
jgi:LemA protein